MYQFPLKVVKGANFDLMKITGASILFRSDFPKTVVLIIKLSIKLIRINVLMLLVSRK